MVKKKPIINLTCAVKTQRKHRLFALSYCRVHADPHPGNLLVRRNPHESFYRRVARAIKQLFGLEISYSPQLVILDHGLYVDIPRDVRYNWCLLWRSLVLGHRQILTDVSNRLMPSGGGILTAALSFGFATTKY
jgi:hypothetical protein